MCPRCCNVYLGRIHCPSCGADMGEHDEIDADINVENYTLAYINSKKMINMHL